MVSAFKEILNYSQIERKSISKKNLSAPVLENKTPRNISFNNSEIKKARKEEHSAKLVNNIDDPSSQKIFKATIKHIPDKFELNPEINFEFDSKIVQKVSSILNNNNNSEDNEYCVVIFKNN